MLGFGLLNVYCRFLWFKSRFWEKCLRWIQANEVWAIKIKRSLQRGPKYPKERQNLGSKAKHRKTKTQRTGENNRAATTVGTTARGGSHGQAVVSPMAMVELFPPVVRFSLRVPLRLPAVFALFCLYICHVSGHIEPPNSLHSKSSSPLEVVLE